jgi:hypothetical protein
MGQFSLVYQEWLLPGITYAVWKKTAYNDMLPEIKTKRPNV